MTTNNMPAFPVTAANMKGDEGMTLRDYFAAKAMQAIVHAYGTDEPDLPAICYKVADGMLKARAK
jgi:hypothetical protein